MLFCSFIWLFIYTSPPVSNCFVDISIPNDDMLCETEDYNLDGDISGNYLDFQWTSNLGYFNDSNLSPRVRITETETFTLCARAISDVNLVSNGDFESGFSDFTSEYTFNSNTNVNGLCQGCFNIDDQTPNAWTTCPEISGDMMVMNAATVTNVNVYCTEVDVCEDTEYIFSTDVMNINNPPPILQFSIDGGLLGSPITGSAPCDVDEFFETWTSGSAGTVEICIVNQNTAASGNDFALDNVLFREICMSKDSFTITFNDFQVEIDDPIELDCQTTMTTLTSTVVDPNFNYTYEWGTTDGVIVGPDDEESVDVSSEGEYFLIVTDQNGCTREEEIDVLSDNDIPDLNVLPPGFINCLNDSIELEVITSSRNEILWSLPNNGQTNENSFFVQDSGIYQVLVTDPFNHCSDSMSISIQLDTSTISQNIQLSNMLDCDNASADLSFTTAGPVNNFSWIYADSVLSANQTVNVTQGGLYILETQFTNGCVELDSINLTQHVPVFNYNIAADDLINCAEPLASIVTNIDTSLYEFSWSGINVSAETNDSFAVSNAGWYRLTILDSLACAKSDSVFISDDFTIPSFTGLEDSITCSKSDATLSLQNVDLGAIVTWIGPSNENYTGETITVDDPGDYSFVVTGQNGCMANGFLTVTASNLFPNLEIAGNVPLDCNTSTATLVGSSDLPSNELFWTAPDNTITNSDQLTVTEPGTYSFNVTTSQGCKDILQAVVTLDTITPDIALSQVTELDCQVVEIVSTFTSSADITETIWTDDQGVTLSVEDSLISTGAGTYYLEVVADNGCKSMAGFEITQDTTKPSIVVKAGAINCIDTSAIISVLTDGDGYQISDDSNNVLIADDTLQTNLGGFYSVVAFGANGCSSSRQVEVLVDTSLVGFSMTADNLGCNRDSVLIETNASVDDYDYELVGVNGGPIDIQEFYLSEEGDYFIQATNKVNGCITSANLTVTTDTIVPDLQLVTRTLLDCNTIEVANTFTSSSDIEEIIWTDDDDNVLSSQDSLFSTVPGDYHLVLIGENGCDTSASFQITQDTISPSLTTDFGLITCTDPLALIEVSTNAIGYVISNDSNIVLSEDAPFQTSSGGVFLVEATAANGCNTTMQIEVEADTMVTEFSLFSDDLGCNQDRVMVEATYFSNDYDYELTGNIAGPFDIEAFYVTEAGTYEVVATNVFNGCKTSASIDVSEITDLPYAFTIDLQEPDCGMIEFEILDFEILGGLEPYEVELNGAAVDNFSIGESLSEGENTFRIQDDNGCLYDTSFVLSTPIVLEVELEEEIEIFWNTDYKLQLELNRNIDEILSITWIDSTSLSCGDCLDPIVNISATETFQAIVEDIYGCTEIASITVIIDSERKVYIPNVFSLTERDASNTTFQLLANEADILQVIEFEIYDRWGNKIFRQENIEITDPSYGWDGYYMSDKVLPGVYTYLISVEFVGGEIEFYSGDLTLLD